MTINPEELREQLKYCVTLGHPSLIYQAAKRYEKMIPALEKLIAADKEMWAVLAEKKLTLERRSAALAKLNNAGTNFINSVKEILNGK